MRARRRILAGCVAALVAAALLSGPLARAGPAGVGSSKAGATRSGKHSASKLTFNKPIALTSDAPLRTAMSGVYGEESDHEWSGEPSIQIDDDGTIYIAGTCCLVAASPVWYSTDGGKTFVEMESPGHLREWGIGAEGDLAVDHDGNVYFVDTYVPGLLVSRWSDHGKTWDFTEPVAGVPPGLNDRPWLAWSEEALYLYVNHASHTTVYRSTDGGRTWLPGVPLASEGAFGGQEYWPGHIAADEKDGTLWAGGLAGSPPNMWGAVSTDGGLTYRTSLVSEPQRDGGFSDIFTGTTAVDAAGNGYTTWSTWDKEGCDLYYAVSTDMGESWGKPVKVNRGRGCATFPWVSAGDDGKIAVVWYQTPVSDVATPGQQFVRALSDRLYGFDLALGFQDQVAFDAPWYVHAATITGADTKSPKVVEARVPTAKPILEGPLGRELWDFFQVDIGRDGRIHIAFVDKYRDNAPQTWYVSSRGGPRLR